jgi:hypothetical protein
MHFGVFVDPALDAGELAGFFQGGEIFVQVFIVGHGVFFLSP